MEGVYNMYDIHLFLDICMQFKAPSPTQNSSKKQEYDQKYAPASHGRRCWSESSDKHEFDASPTSSDRRVLDEDQDEDLNPVPNAASP